MISLLMFSSTVNHEAYREHLERDNVPLEWYISDYVSESIDPGTTIFSVLISMM